MASSNYHLPTIAAVAGFALAASGYVLSTNNFESKKRKQRDGRYIYGLTNTGNFCFLNAAFATLSSLRSYLAERIDEQGDETTTTVPQNQFILQSVACALYATIELLNSPISRSKSITPIDFLNALEAKFGGSINRDQQDVHELFQIISSVLTNEEEVQYKQNATSLLDAATIKGFTIGNDTDYNNDSFETSSVSSFGTTASMWSSFSVCTVGGSLRPRRRSPRNPFTGLAASRISCVNCGYTAPIRHHTFDNISLSVPQTVKYLFFFWISFCTLESCLNTYTKVDTLNDFHCRKCVLSATLESVLKELASVEGKDEEQASRLKVDVGRIKDALLYNVEASLYGIPLVQPTQTPCTTKQTMFANPPKALCLHLSRSVYHPSGMIQKNTCQVQFSEYLDLAPFTTNGYLNTSDPGASLSSPPSTPVLHQTRTSRASLVYLRNMANGHRFTHSANKEEGLTIALMSNKEIDRPVQSALPSLSVLPVHRAIQYRLCAVIVHQGQHHQSGHFITYRRKKLPTGHEVRSPLGDSKPRQVTKFWRCSDELVEEVDLDVVLQSEAYMLFYERDV
ncbi:hypothetical protein BY458DRAFT_440487 [Sporodiniella umbellata]|nr:hypothetical protein BY458DRAFT_440487 [Sporodiniella umbellata]